jgi:putative ABC transport system permease protein
VRHRARTATTLAAIAFGVTGLILSQGFVQDIFTQLGEAVVHSQTGHIQIARKDYFAHGAHRPLKFMLIDAEREKKRIRAVSGVNDVATRLNFPALLNNGRADLAVLIEGVEPEKEEKLGTFVHFTAGRPLHREDGYSVVVGHGVAQALALKPGDDMTLVVSTAEGAMNTIDVRLIGIFQSFSKEYDNRAVKVPLAAAQELLSTNGGNVLVVLLDETRRTDEIAATLAEGVIGREEELRTWTQLNDFYPKTVLLYNRQFGGLLLIILLMVLLSVANSVNMTVFERTSEFGTARALGNRRGDVVRLVLIENALLGIAGSVIGVVLGTALAVTISTIGINMPPPPNADLSYVAHVQVTPWALATAFGIGVAATVLAAVPAAFKVARMSIVDALRESV